MRIVRVSLVTAALLLFDASVLVQAAGADRARGAGSAAGSAHRAQSGASSPDRRTVTSSQRAQSGASSPDRRTATSSHRVQSSASRPDPRTTATSHRATLPAGVAPSATGAEKAKAPFPGIDDPSRPTPVQLQGLARGRGGANDDHTAYIQHGPMYWQLAHSLVWGVSLGPRRRVYSSVVWPEWGPLPVPSPAYDEDLRICSDLRAAEGE